MGWVIVVFVVLVVLGITRRRTTKTRTKMSQQMSVLESQAHQPRSTSLFPQSSQPMPGQPATAQPMPTSATQQFAQSIQALQSAWSGEIPTGTAPASQRGGPATYRPARSPSQAASSPTYRPGEAAALPTAEAQTRAPAPVAPRPRVKRSPPEKRYQGSTAVSGSSLSTTLCTPYQPSSLMTSLSSSLSSSLTDSPPRMGSSVAFSGIQVVPLPTEVAEQVRFHLRNGHEVEAVRLVCETMDVGLLEATKTVRSYA